MSANSVQTEGEAPSSRDKIACAAVGNKFYVFGGFGPRDAAKKEADRVEQIGTEAEHSVLYVCVLTGCSIEREGGRGRGRREVRRG